MRNEPIKRYLSCSRCGGVISGLPKGMGYTFCECSKIDFFETSKTDCIGYAEVKKMTVE